MRVLVTGGAGFIGSHLIERLLERNCQVCVLDNFSSGSPERLAPFGDALDVIEGDVCDPSVVERAVAGAEAVFHLAAMVSVVQSVAEPVAAYAINTAGTVQLLEAARRAGVRRLALASTCAIYGDTERLPVSEADPVAPVSPYAASKLAAEQACQLYSRLHGLETVALRFFNVYGPRQDPASPYAAVVPRFAASLRAGQQPTIFGDGLQSRDFIFVGDIVEALWTAATAPGLAGRLFNVGRGEQTSVLDLARTVGAHLGVPVNPVFAPARDGEVRHSRADVSAYAAAGFRASHDLREGLRLTLAG